jgi:hypothetical protein
MALDIASGFLISLLPVGLMVILPDIRYTFTNKGNCKNPQEMFFILQNTRRTVHIPLIADYLQLPEIFTSYRMESMTNQGKKEFKCLDYASE